jgi:hypothetical protein
MMVSLGIKLGDKGEENGQDNQGNPASQSVRRK